MLSAEGTSDSKKEEGSENKGILGNFFHVTFEGIREVILKGRDGELFQVLQ